MDQWCHRQFRGDKDGVQFLDFARKRSLETFPRVVSVECYGQKLDQRGFRVELKEKTSRHFL